MGTVNTATSYTRALTTELLSKDKKQRSISTTYSTLNRTNSVSKGDNYSNYKYLIANGYNATTTLSGVEWRHAARPTYVYAEVIEYGAALPPSSYPHFTLGLDSGSYTNTVGSTFDAAELVNADNQAKLKFISQVRNLQTTMSGGVFLGELRETLRAVKRPAQSLRNGLDDYFGALQKRRRGIRGSPTQRRETLRQIAGNTWLEYSFGWKPLVNDIDDAMKAAADHLNGSRNPVTKMVRGSGKIVKHLASGEMDDTVTFNGSVIVHKHRQITTEYHVKYYGKVNIEHPTKLTAQRLGLSLDHFVPTAWELVPWSFLVDYFTNIGGILEAASTCLSGLRWMSKSTLEVEKALWTDVRTSSTKIFVDGQFVDRHSIRLIVPGSSLSQHRRITRAPYSGTLVPRLEFKIPGFGTKWINLGALALTQKRLRPYY